MNFLNVKDVITKNLQSENEHRKEKLSSLENKLILLENNQNMLELHGRRNNIDINIDYQGLLTLQSSLEEKVVSVFSRIGADVTDVTSNDKETCHGKEISFFVTVMSLSPGHGCN